MTEINALTIGIGFIKFVSSLVGEAIKTVINKKIEFKMDNNNEKKKDDYIRSNYISGDVINNPTIYINKNNSLIKIDEKNFSKDRRYQALKKIYQKKNVPLVILSSNTLKQPLYREKLADALKNIKDIYISEENYEIDYIKKVLFDVPVIFIDISIGEDDHLVSSITIWNIVPGINSAKTLKLNFNQQNNIYDFNLQSDKMCEYIVTIVMVIKDTFSYCRLSLKDSFERLRIESNILYEMGYKEIEFQQTDIGFFIQLSDSPNKEILVYLLFEYPIVSPILLIKKGNNIDKIHISQKVWSADCTIGQLVYAIHESC